MFKFSARLAPVLACLPIGLIPSVAHASKEDTQFWFYAIATGDLDENTHMRVDGSLRFREEARGDEQQTLRVTLEQDVLDGVRTGGGIGVFDAGGQTEIRPFHQTTISKGRVSARTRVELRFFDGAPRVELRLRQRLRYTQPVTDNVSASIAGEWLHLAQTQRPAIDPARDQWRLRSEIAWAASPDIRLAAAYMTIYTPQPTGPDRINHVPQATLTYRF